MSTTYKGPEQCFAAIVLKMLLFTRDFFLPIVYCFYWISSCVTRMVLKSDFHVVDLETKKRSLKRHGHNITSATELIFVTSTLWINSSE